MKVLCLGARLGGEVRAFRALGALSVGIDLNPGSNNPLVLEGDFHHIQFADETSDVIFTNVIGHAFDLRLLGNEICRVLKPTGTTTSLCTSSSCNIVVPVPPHRATLSPHGPLPHECGYGQVHGRPAGGPSLSRSAGVTVHLLQRQQRGGPRPRPLGAFCASPRLSSVQVSARDEARGVRGSSSQLRPSTRQLGRYIARSSRFLGPSSQIGACVRLTGKSTCRLNLKNLPNLLISTHWHR